MRTRPSARRSSTTTPSTTAWCGKDGGRPTPTHLWYGEHDAPHGPLNDGDAAPDWLKGGVGACSTDDLIEWKREGIALHYANLTDMTDRRDAWQLGCDGYGTIHGTKGGYGCVGSKGLVASRPRVLTADVEQKPDSNDPYASTRPDAPRVVQGHGYVMWMVVHNGSKGRGLAGVASSAHAGGPFHFRRTLYPDDNGTRDMAVWAVGGGRRTGRPSSRGRRRCWGGRTSRRSNIYCRARRCSPSGRWRRRGTRPVSG